MIIGRFPFSVILEYVSGINCNKNESDYNKTNPQLKRSQLGRYWSEACKEVDENNVTAYLLCPEYKSKELEIEKGGYETGKRYKVISYKNFIYHI